LIRIPPAKPSSDGYDQGRIRDDRPFGSRAPPAALHYASRDRSKNIPSGIFATSPALASIERFCRYNASANAT
jgi:hypothetical protein